MSSTLFRNARIFDGVNDKLSAPTSVLIQGDRVESIGADGSQAEIEIDVEGRTLMPGLIDAHFHAYASDTDFVKLEKLPPTYLAQRARHLMEDALRRGFTTVRDVGAVIMGYGVLSKKVGSPDRDCSTVGALSASPGGMVISGHLTKRNHPVAVTVAGSLLNGSMALTRFERPRAKRSAMALTISRSSFPAVSPRQATRSGCSSFPRKKSSRSWTKPAADESMLLPTPIPRKQSCEP